MLEIVLMVIWGCFILIYNSVPGGVCKPTSRPPPRFITLRSHKTGRIMYLPVDVHDQN